MADTTWQVRRVSNAPEEAQAETWWIDHGDLIFGSIQPVTNQGVTTYRQVPSRAFAAGQWKEVTALV